jgi:protein O-GlcNAc transferase
VALYRGGKYTEALSYCDKALEVKSDYPDAWINKGLVYYEMGRRRRSNYSLAICD